MKVCDACKPGVRCRPCSERSKAHWRLVRSCMHPEVHDVMRPHTHPVEWANQQTSYHDCRVALCLAMGVAIEDIDPCTGHEMRRRPAQAGQAAFDFDGAA